MKLFKIGANSISDVVMAYENAVDRMFYMMNFDGPTITKQMIYDKIPLSSIKEEDIVKVDGIIAEIDLMRIMTKRG